MSDLLVFTALPNWVIIVTQLDMQKNHFSSVDMGWGVSGMALSVAVVVAEMGRLT